MNRRRQTEIATDMRCGRGWLIAIGIVSIILGVAALLFPWWTTLGIEIAIGLFLVIIGVLELLRVLYDRARLSIVPNLVFGALAILAGVLLLMYPMEGVFTLTLVLTFFFLLGGIFKTTAAFALRPAPGWGLMLTSGIVSVLLGIIVLAALPESALWILGVLFGIDLLFFGAAQIAFASVTREIDRTGPV